MIFIAMHLHFTRFPAAVVRTNNIYHERDIQKGKVD